MKKVIKIKTEEYLERFRKNRGGIKSLKWNSYSSAALRYVNLLRDIDFHNKSILDVGCGFGDIIPYLFSMNSCSFSYTGIDMMSVFVEEAKRRYPEFKFLNGDYFLKPLEKKFDIIICCGALNSNFRNAIDYRKKAIKTMFEKCNIALTFNMAGGINISNQKSSKIYYVNSRTILDFCLALSKKIIFKQHYHSKDFTIVMYK
jgi:SAM-dependent methyltransferase